jgi:hypothetical protein
MRILLKNIKETKEMICEKYSRFPKQRVCFWNVLQKRFVFLRFWENQPVWRPLSVYKTFNKLNIETLVTLSLI